MGVGLLSADRYKVSRPRVPCTRLLATSKSSQVPNPHKSKSSQSSWLLIEIKDGLKKDPALGLAPARRPLNRLLSLWILKEGTHWRCCALRWPLRAVGIPKGDLRGPNNAFTCCCVDASHTIWPSCQHFQLIALRALCLKMLSTSAMFSFNAFNSDAVNKEQRVRERSRIDRRRRRCRMSSASGRGAAEGARVRSLASDFFRVSKSEFFV